MTPADLADRAVKFAHLDSEIVDPARAARLAFVGKAVTFDTGGYFLKPQSDIVRQNADRACPWAHVDMLVELATRLSVTLTG